MVRIDNRGDDIAAEGRADLIQEVRVLLARLGVLVVPDFELRTVGRQTAVQRRRDTRCEVPAHGRSAEQRDLGLLLFDQAAHHGRVGQRAERLEELVIGHPHRVSAVLGQFLFQTGEVVSQRHGFDFHAERRGQFAALGQQFETHVGDLAALHLDIYKYVVHLRAH